MISLLKSDFGFSRRKLDDGKLDDGKLVRGMLEPWVVRTAKKFTVAFYPGNDATSVKKTGVDTLYIPQSSQFPVVDAVIVSAKGDATLIQVTVSAEHKPKAEAVQALLDKLEENELKVKSFVWVVDMSSGLKKKQGTSGLGVADTYNALPQYLCRIGAQMCWVKSVNSTAVCFPISSSERTADDILKHIKEEVDAKATKVTNVASINGTQGDPYIFE